MIVWIVFAVYMGIGALIVGISYLGYRERTRAVSNQERKPHDG